MAGLASCDRQIFYTGWQDFVMRGAGAMCVSRKMLAASSTRPRGRGALLDFLRHHLLQLPEMGVVDPVFLELGDGLIEIVGAGAPVTGGPGQGPRHLRVRQLAGVIAGSR